MIPLGRVEQGLPPGAAPPQPFPAPPPPSEPRTTAEANAVADKERRARKAPALAAAARLSNPQVWDAAMAEIDKNREVPDLLINELTEKMRATTVQENAILLWKKITLQNDYYRAAKDLAALRANGGAPGDIANMEKLEYERYRAMDKLDQILKRTGTEWGRAGQFRRQLAREDYTLGTMLLSAQAAAGRELTQQERAEVTAQSEAISRAEDAVEVEEGLVARGAGKAKGSQGDLRDLRIALDRLKTQFRQHQAGRRDQRRPPSERAISTVRTVSDAQRALRTAADLSSVLRQGGLYALAHPVRAYEAFRKALPFFTDQRAFDRSMAEMKDDPDFPLYERSGGFFADRDAGVTAQEEAFMGNFWGRVAEGRGPSWMNNMAGRGLGKVVVASERFYTGHLNLIRFAGFKDMIQAYTGGQPTAEQAKAAANFMNVLTGRGKLGQTFDKAAVPLAQVFFSPRHVVSRFQLIMAQPFYDAPGMKMALAKEYGRVLGGAAVLYGLVKMLMGDEAEVTFDPRSSDFGKIKVGETRIDPLAGLAQVSTLTGRMVTGQTKDTAGVVTSLRGDVPPGGETLMGTAAKFVRSKLAPIPSEGVNVVTGRDYFNEPTTAGKVIVGLGVPMSLENVAKGWMELGLGYGSLAGAINTLGVGVQNYGSGKDPTQRAVADVHAMRRKWEYDLGRPQEPRTGPPLVAEMEKAVGADDYGAFVEARTNFLNKQILAGRTRVQAIASFKESSERLDPLEGRLNARDRAKFLGSLTPQQKARVLEAQKMARERRAKLRAWWARASQSR